MYAGRIVEEGPTASIFDAPQHPYTWSLLQSVPRVDTAGKERLLAIAGQPPNPRDLPTGCKFHPRCRFAIARCTDEEPPLRSGRAGAIGALLGADAQCGRDGET